jgi:hypothetical protein
MRKISVIKPFTYYINGYERRDFEIGEHEAPYDCAAYAEEYGYAEIEGKKKEEKKDDKVEDKEEEKKDDGTAKPARSKKTSTG